MSDERGKLKPSNEVRGLCLRLLACVAIRTGPADIILDSVKNKIEAENFGQQVDATSELEFHLNSIHASLDTKSIPGT
uniref:Uncharacterized protein n=1 Tax=Globisporangium ultimum (strain ATCC 200006 / CBS 805.95 / DAOM BR144) TaxID=431595 RepID=K3WHR6_GLOUD